MTSNHTNNFKRTSCFLAVLMAAGFVTGCGDSDDFPGSVKTTEERSALDRVSLEHTNDIRIAEDLNHFDGADFRTHENVLDAVHSDDIELPDYEAEQFDLPENIEIRGEIDEHDNFSSGCAEYGAWKELAWNTCEKYNGELEELAATDSCVHGTDSVEYSCIVETSEGDLERESFTSQVLGGTNSCKTYEQYKLYAVELCDGGELVQIQPMNPCNPENSREHFKSFMFTCIH
jgi:hypothetical protein